MSLARPRKPDRNKIDISNDEIARHWAKKLGKTKDEIAAAVAKVGENAQTVQKELGCDPAVPSTD